MLKVEKLCYHYKNGPKVLKDVDFAVKDGQFMAILGNNGVGKSTMLKCQGARLQREFPLLRRMYPIPK